MKVLKGRDEGSVVDREEGRVYGWVGYNEVIKERLIVRCMWRGGKGREKGVKEWVKGWIKEELLIELKIERCN